MSKVVFVSGGARSGKSAFAEELAKESKKVLYIATSKVFDDEMRERVKLHQERRPSSWKTVEQYTEFDLLENNEFFIEADCILLDCLTLMMSNIFFDNINISGETEDIDKEVLEDTEKMVYDNIKSLIDICKKNQKTLIIVTNEIGLGIVPENKMSRMFRDLSGKINQLVASISNEVYMVFMGIPNRIK